MTDEDLLIFSHRRGAVFRLWPPKETPLRIRGRPVVADGWPAAAAVLWCLVRRARPEAQVREFLEQDLGL